MYAHAKLCGLADQDCKWFVKVYDHRVSQLAFESFLTEVKEVIKVQAKIDKNVAAQQKTMGSIMGHREDYDQSVTDQSETVDTARLADVTDAQVEKLFGNDSMLVDKPANGAPAVSCHGRKFSSDEDGDGPSSSAVSFTASVSAFGVRLVDKLSDTMNAMNRTQLVGMSKTDKNVVKMNTKLISEKLETAVHVIVEGAAANNDVLQLADRVPSLEDEISKLKSAVKLQTSLNNIPTSDDSAALQTMKNKLRVLQKKMDREKSMRKDATDKQGISAQKIIKVETKLNVANEMIVVLEETTKTYQTNNSLLKNAAWSCGVTFFAQKGVYKGAQARDDIVGVVKKMWKTAFPEDETRG